MPNGILDPVPGAVVMRLAEIDRGHGRAGFLEQRSPAVLAQLATDAVIRSVIASNEIEGVTVPGRRGNLVAAGAAEPRDRGEAELAGYRAALDDVFAHPHEPVTVPRMLAWHRSLLGHAGASVAGRLKTLDNDVVDLVAGRRVSRFRTISARDTPGALVELTERHEAALRAEQHHPFVLCAAFVLDLLVIHPFEDGNGRVARIATTALLLRSGYGVCRYVSLEELVAERRTAYYEVLRASTEGWHEAAHDVWPWTGFLAEVLADAYKRFESQASAWTAPDARALVDVWLRTRAPVTFSFGEASRTLPAVSRSVLRSVLDEWRRQGGIALEGAGRGARWRVLHRAGPP